ncbi:MAG: 3'(2'), 5'-bisphosphate nucleotidase [Myxococcota bacterium]|jgi:3'(2'), 5'-bisphosphate nucleotidase
MSLDHERAVAIDAVVKASRVCLAVQQRLVAGTTLEKGDKSPVTVADFGAQAIVSHLLADAFPAVPLVGEEDAAALREPSNAALKDKVCAAVRAVLPELSDAAILDAIDRGTYGGGGSGRHWTLDPIDGTKGFLRLDQYAVALALIDDGEVVLGVLGCPNLPVSAADADGPRGCIFVGVQGEGAFQRTLDDATETAIRVTDIADPSQASFCESVEKAHSSHGHSAQIADRLGITVPPFRIDSQCKYAAVARGDASIYLRLPTRPGYVEKIWDHAGGWRVIVEAGGKVTDVTGAPLDFGLGRGLANNRGVIVTNGHVHDAVLEAVAAVLDG